eukprot:gene988-301_t
MQKAFQELLELQKKKMKEAENQFLGLSKSSSGGKPIPPTGAGITQQNLPDEQLIREVNLAMSSENERMSKLGAKKKVSKPINVNLGVENSAKQPSVEPKGRNDKILAAIEALQADKGILPEAVRKRSASETANS